LSSSCYEDKKRRGVNGFFAFVYSEIDDNIGIPSFNIKPFIELYEKEVSPYWNCLEGDRHYSQIHSFSMDDDISKIYAHKNEYSAILNTNVFQCKSLGNGNKNEIISAALAFPKISLLIDNEDMSEATGSKGSFMNCLSSKLQANTVKVKHICPKCQKYVYGFTENGICSECDKIDIEPIKTENDMKSSDVETNERDLLERKLHNCHLDIDELNKKLSKERRINKILNITCGVFLLIIAYLWYNHKANIPLESKKELVRDSIARTEQDSFNFEVPNKAFEISAEGKDSLLITWRSNLPKIQTNIDNYNWINVRSAKATSLLISVDTNKVNIPREAHIELKLGNQKETISIKQFSPKQ